METCTEGQCIRALKATSEALHTGPAHAGLVPYAGPQCYPQLKERLWANTPQQMETAGRGPKRGAVKARAGTEDEDLRVLAEQFENCWMRCDDCGARRLVERGSAASLRSESFQKVTEGSEAGFWGQWLREARSRHDAFLEKWSEKKPGWPISQQQFCAPCEQAQGSGEGPEGGGEAIGVDGEQGDRDDGIPPGGSVSGSEGAGSGEEDAEWRDALEAAKRQLGARGAGLSPAEQEELDAMEAQE